LLNNYIAIISQVIGSSLKIIGTAFLDELHIFFTSINKIKITNSNLSIMLLILWQIYMLIIGFVGGYGYSLVFYRYALVFISIIFLVNYYRRFLNLKNPTIFITVGFSYLVIFILIIYFPRFIFFFDKSKVWDFFWWQDFFWAGTTYASYVIYIIVGLTFILNNNFRVRISILGLAYFIVLSVDSRLGLILITSLVPFVAFGKQKIKKKLNLIKFCKNFIFYLIFIILTISIIFNYHEIISQNIQSAVMTFEELFFQTNDRDYDRRNDLQSIQHLAENNVFNFILGHGLSSHQFELLKYIDQDNLKIRPVGLTAIIFDGGIIYLLIIILCALNSIYKIINYALSKFIPTWTAILWLTLILNSILVLLIVNVSDLMLWWAVILSGEIFAKKFMIYIKKKRFRV
jgi:hypothetical protein